MACVEFDMSKRISGRVIGTASAFVTESNRCLFFVLCYHTLSDQMLSSRDRMLLPEHAVLDHVDGVIYIIRCSAKNCILLLNDDI